MLTITSPMWYSNDRGRGDTKIDWEIFEIKETNCYP
jgi:hypothetical protein